MGEQAIGEVFGGNLVNLDEVFHGVQTPAHIVDFVEYGEHKVDYLFRGLHRDILVVGAVVLGDVVGAAVDDHDARSQVDDILPESG